MHSAVQTAVVTIISYKPLSGLNSARYTRHYGSYMPSSPLGVYKPLPRQEQPDCETRWPWLDSLHVVSHSYIEQWTIATENADSPCHCLVWVPDPRRDLAPRLATVMAPTCDESVILAQ